ncbi:unnamed protein product [Rotaria magnacalcarata]|uniref:CTLH domain-containing protein n=1 Tax=Rotaria magnacalcarata TaxID=392030 RepID=A0A816TPZ7_9BILA|nr:unnamed protein product [Rotaria magnacalcarata]
MHTANPNISQQPLISSVLDDNNTTLTTSDTATTLERLKQNLNGNISNNINNSSISSSTQTNHCQLHTKIFSNSEKEILKLIGQHLQSVGLSQTVDSLILESGCVLEHEQASNFRDLIISGKWTEALIALGKLKQYIAEQDGIQQMEYLILEQKYFELIEDEQAMEALYCLRNEIRPLNIRIERTHQLTAFLMFTSMKDMYKAANWSGKGFASRDKLMEKLQRKLSIEDVSLLQDHACSKQALPCVTVQTLTNHTDEVWFCKFSPDGTKLATGSKDGNLFIYDVDMTTYKLKLRKHFDGHSFGIGFIAWCPFSRYIIACGTDECSEIWIWDIQREEQRSRIHHTPDDSLTCAAWLPCGTRFVCGGSRGQFYYCDIDGNVIDNWEGVRLQCLNVTSDGVILAADAQKRISSYKFDSLTDHQIIHEDHPIMSFTISKDGRSALLNIATQGVHLWDLHDRQLLRKYQGVTQGHYVNHATFGGPNEEFIASGSEDSNVYLWHRKQERPIMIFSGHTRTVNCVSWHPILPLLFASASDDATVRIWSTTEHQCQTESSTNSD